MFDKDAPQTYFVNISAWQVWAFTVLFKSNFVNLPVSFSLILEVVHVTACLGILSILGLSFFGLRQFQ